MLTWKVADQFVAKLKESAKRLYGFTDEELRRSDLRGFNEWTKSQRILRLVRLAHYRGKLMGLSLVWNELSQPYLVRKTDDYDWRPQPAIRFEEYCGWSDKVREDAAREGFCEVELKGSGDFSAYTHSARILRLCNLAYARGTVRGVRIAQEMGQDARLRSSRMAKQAPAGRLAS